MPSQLDTRRAVGIVLMVLLLFVIMGGLQGMFDASDRKKAVQAVLAWRPGGEGKPSAGDAMVKETPDAACDASITSGCRGTVRVRCAGAAGGRYEFQVDLVKNTVEPASERARTLAESLGR